MCFSQSGSIGFAVLGSATAALLKARGHPLRRYGLFLYFALMEFIQFGAYFVVDQCGNPWNKLFTMLAYTHVCFQNSMVNLFFLSPEFGVHPDVTKLVVTMCVTVGAMGILTKLPWPVWLGAPVGMLDGLAKALPEFFSYSTAGTPASCMYETMCAAQVCTFSTPRHIAWSLPVMPPSYYLPNSFSHFLFFFFPTLIMGNREAKLTMALAFLTGPLLTQLMAAQYPETYKFEWPATWCYMSVAQCFNALALEAYSVYRQRQTARHKSGTIPQVHMQTDGLSQPEGLQLEACSVSELDVDAISHGPDSPKKVAKKKQ